MNMKKLLQMKFMLLLCALIVGSGTAWADDELYYTLDGTKTDTGGNSNYAQAGNDVTQNSMNWSVTANCTQSPWRIGGKNLSEVDREVYSKTAMASAITKVELEIGDINLTANSIKFVVASDAAFETTLYEETVSEVTANQTYTFVPTSGSEWATGAYYKFVFNVTAPNSNKYIQLKSAKFYKAGATFSPLDHITLSGDNYPTTFYVGDTFSHEGMTVMATYVNETTKDVTTGATFSGYDMSTAGVQTVTVSYTQGEGDNAITKSATYNITVKGLSSVRLDGQYPLTFTEGDAFSHEGMTVYAVYTDGTNGSEEDVTSDAVFSEPDMTTVGNQNVTVSYTKNNVTKSTEYEITINALPTHNVTWSVNGTVTEPVSYKEGAAITFPANPADIEGKSFVGWTTAAIEGTTNTAPDFVTSATMGETDITFYAVFANAEGGAASLVEMASTDTFADGDNVVVVANDGEKDYAIYQETVSTSWVKKYEFDGNVTTVAADEKNWLTVTKNDNTWKLGDSTNGYLYSSSSNNLSVSTDNSSSFTLGYSENKGFTLKTGGRWLSLRTDTDNNTFRLGGTGNAPLGAGYFRIFKYTEGGLVYTDYSTTVVADTRLEAGLGFVESTATVEWYSANQYTGQALTNPHSVSPITWTSSNEGVATVENDGTVTVLALGETTIKASFDGDNNYKKGEASYTLTVQDSRTALELSFDPESVEVNVNATVAIPTLNGNQGNGTVTYTSGDETIATVDANTSLVTGVAEGTTTITATVAATNEYKEGTATFTVTVIDPNKKGSQNNPYTVAEARAAIDAGTGVTEVYARGIVSEIVTAFNSQYGNITYNISEDGSTTSDQLQAYRGKSYNGDAFTSADDIQVGDVVVVYGDLKKYEDTYEFAQNNQLVSLKRARIIVEQTSYEADAKYTGTGDGHVSVTINFTHENVTMHGGDSRYASDFNAVVMCDANGNPTTYDWLKFMLFVPEDGVGFFYFNDNNGAPRTAYLKLHGVDADGLDVYSELITITQDGVAINVDETEIEAPYTQIGGTIGVTYANFTPSYESLYVQFYDEDDNEINDCDWMSAVIDENDINTLNYFITTNDGNEERTAYLRVCWTAGTAPVVSDLITVTQAKPVETVTYTLAHSITPGRHYIIASGTDENVYAMGGQNNNNRKAEEVTANNGVITVTNNVAEFLIEVDDKGYFTIKDEDTNNTGYLYAASNSSNQLKTQTENNNKGEWKIEIDGNGVATIKANKTGGHNWMRYNSTSDCFSCYDSEQNNIYLFEKDGDEGTQEFTVSIADACTDGEGKYYGTFSAPFACTVPSDVTVSEIAVVNGVMAIESYEAGVVIPANTGVMISSETPGTKTFTSAKGGTSVLDAENCLRPTFWGITADEMAAADESCVFYRLTMHNGTTIGFWWGNDGGNSFDIAANKAYMAVPAGQAAREGFAFDDDSTTGISNVNVNENVNGSIFDLQGRKVSTPGKGLYIVNGKKVVIK